MHVADEDWSSELFSSLLSPSSRRWASRSSSSSTSSSLSLRISSSSSSSFFRKKLETSRKDEGVFRVDSSLPYSPPPCFCRSDFPNEFGSFGRGSHEPKYRIEFHPEDSPFHPDEDQETVVLPNRNGQNYLCVLPKVEKTKSKEPVVQHNISSVILETEQQIKLKTPDELLELLKDQCFVRQEGWWSYEFCYQKRLRQIHVEDEKVVQEFVLGVYDAEATAAFNQNLSDVSQLKDPRSIDASQRYHAHQYTNGTICDLTNEPRQTEVRFVCSEPRALISSITELSTCKYALTVRCPTLCKHPLFQEERPVWHTINCNVLPKDYKESNLKDGSKDKQIVMVKEDIEDSSKDSVE